MTDPSPADREVRVTHVFDAPPEAVFAAWTDPEQVATWWAPDGFHIPRESVEIEPRVGGRFHLVMAQSDGEDRFPFRSEIVEIVEHERIVLKGESIDEAGIGETITRVVFEPDGAGTRMTVTTGPYTDEVRGSAETGWIELMGNLERLLAAS